MYPLTINTLKAAAVDFGGIESAHYEPSLYGVTDGKAVGTYLEHKFREYLCSRFTLEVGNSAKGIDLPDLGVDIKTTSVRQPQSSCPFQSPRQKVFGLGYALLVFVYAKADDSSRLAARLSIEHVIFVEAERTADYQMTRGLREIIQNDANEDDVAAFLLDRRLPIDDIEAARIAKEILRSPPKLGYLTISNALQWRLQYGRAIAEAGSAEGVHRLR